jgi:hypothetical protein
VHNAVSVSGVQPAMQSILGRGCGNLPPVERIDARKNMARYYAMSIEPNLFGEACLIRRWGRIGASGQADPSF